MEFTEHILERYAERIQDKKNRNEIKTFVAQNRDRIKNNIQKLFDSAEFLCTTKIKDHNITNFYVNKDGWVLISDKENKKLITLYKVDLFLGSDFNKYYIEKMTEDIKSKMEEYTEFENTIEIQKAERVTERKEIESGISGLKAQIKWQEENLKLLEQQDKEAEAHLKVKKQEVQQQIENFVGARIFELFFKKFCQELDKGKNICYNTNTIKNI